VAQLLTRTLTLLAASAALAPASALARTTVADVAGPPEGRALPVLPSGHVAPTALQIPDGVPVHTDGSSVRLDQLRLGDRLSVRRAHGRLRDIVVTRRAGTPSFAAITAQSNRVADLANATIDASKQATSMTAAFDQLEPTLRLLDRVRALELTLTDLGATLETTLHTAAAAGPLATAARPYTDKLVATRDAAATAAGGATRLQTALEQRVIDIDAAAAGGFPALPLETISAASDLTNALQILLQDLFATAPSTGGHTG